ncbi:S-layer homology domain-containing protein [Peptoniphilus equinus]|uniref:S-layer homology domain-containing protein n=1 Tax=Peptoniphilus equinus TaxID=3016343 RepID=A0ABY7QRD5_9FIRM|nr:S-layer homology domain-containing protein [Peptoniphilus equinus]WBW49352.1 S-layer homology domain-containing protein [Peptoniphilus equinus]
MKKYRVVEKKMFLKLFFLMILFALGNRSEKVYAATLPEGVPENTAYILEETQIGVSIYYDKNFQEIGFVASGLQGPEPTEHNTRRGLDLIAQIGQNGPDPRILQGNILANLKDEETKLLKPEGNSFFSYKYRLTLYEDLELPHFTMIRNDITIVSANSAQPQRIYPQKEWNMNQLYLFTATKTFGSDPTVHLSFENVILDGDNRVQGIDVIWDNELYLINVVLQNFTTKDFPSYDSGWGGAIDLNTSSKLFADGVQFINNSTKLGNGLGGAIAMEKSTQATIKNSLFKGNQADFGGAIGVQADSSMTTVPTLNLENVLFEENIATSSGGAIYLGDDGIYAQASITGDSRFEKNKAGGAGGGAIFTTQYSYQNPADRNKYQNLMIADTVVFQGNQARYFLFPPDNYQDFTNLAFSENSFKGAGNRLEYSLLNHYDINYYPNPSRLVKYVFESADTSKPLPEELNNLLPQASYAAEGSRIVPEPPKVPEFIVDGGVWIFDTWKPQEGSVPTGDGELLFTGIWKFTKEEDPQPAPQPEPEHGNPWYIDVSGINMLPDPVKTEVHKAYLKGYPESVVLPEGNMTRAEAVAVVARLQGYTFDDGGHTVFSDTAQDGWYNKYINAAFAHNLLVEKSGEPFRPDDAITRAELAKLIQPLDKTNSAVAPFEDVKGHLYEDALNQAYGNGRITGYPDGTFRPDAAINRAEVATLLNRLYDRKADVESLKALENQSLLKSFTDLKPTHWAYFEVMEAANSHEYVRRSMGSIVEDWLRLIQDSVE